MTNDISKYTRANIFSEVGKETPLLLRFSTVAGEMGAADAERDVRGFAVASAGAASFLTMGKEIDRQVEFDAGVSYAHKSGFNLNAGLFGEAGDISLYGANISLSKSF